MGLFSQLARAEPEGQESYEGSEGMARTGAGYAHPQQSGNYEDPRVDPQMIHPNDIVQPPESYEDPRASYPPNPYPQDAQYADPYADPYAAPNSWEAPAAPAHGHGALPFDPSGEGQEPPRWPAADGGEPPSEPPESSEQ